MPQQNVPPCACCLARKKRNVVLFASENEGSQDGCDA